MQFDAEVIIIGAGLGGLTAGATLAKLGRKVLLLEQHYVPGGCATTFKRKDYLMEVGLHEMDGLDSADPKQQIFEYLDLNDKLEFQQIPELYKVAGVSGDFVLPHGEAEYCRTLCNAFPQEKKAIRTFISLMTSARREAIKFPRKPWQRRLLIPFFPLLFPSLTKCSRMTLGEYLDRYFKTEKLKLLLIANLGYYHDDPYTMSLIYYSIAQAGYIEGGGHFVKGGSQQLSNCMVDIIRANGGVVLLGKMVTGIDVCKGQVVGVTYRDAFNTSLSAETVKTNHVIANAAVPLVANMLPTLYGERLCRMIAQQERACSLLSVYIGFDRDLRDLGSQHYSTFIGLDRVETLRDFRANICADLDEREFVFVDYGVINSGLSPKGKTFGCICTIDYLSNWEGLDLASYRVKKNEVARQLIDRLEAYLPGISKAVEHYEVGTPRTIQSYTLNPGGVVYGFAQIPGQDGSKRYGYASPVHGLDFASAWAHPGGGFTGAIISGFTTAQAVRAKIDGDGLTVMEFSDPRSVRFVRRRIIAEDTFELVVEKPADFEPGPGQYAFVNLDVIEEATFDVPLRALSIVSSAEESIVRFAMRVSDSGFKRGCLAMDLGSTVTLYGPTGDFLLPEIARPTVFLVGGIGITPVIPMVKSLEKQSFVEETHIIYSAHTLGAMAYLDELQAIQHENFSLHPIDTTKQPRINGDRITEILGEVIRFHYYIVGTTSFLKSMREILVDQNVPQEQITVDDFG